MKTWSGVKQCLTVTLWMTLLPNVVFSQCVSRCGGRLTGECGVFSSPNFPWNYPDNVECNWEITLSEGKKVLLEFDSSFDVSVLENAIDSQYLNITI